MSAARQAFADAVRRLFARYGLAYEGSSLALRDRAVSIGVHECGTGEGIGRG